MSSDPAKDEARSASASSVKNSTTSAKRQKNNKPIVVIGAGVNGSAIAMELARQLHKQKSRQRVILLDLYGYPDPRHIDNSSRGDTRITRMSNAEHPALTHTAIDTARFYTKLMRKFETSSKAGYQKIARMLEDKYEGAMLYNPHGFVFTMPRVSASREFHGHSNEHGNAYERTLRNAQDNGIQHEVMDGHEFAKRFPGFRINDDDKDTTNVYYEPQCLVKDERKESWFPTGGTLYAERCVATHLAMFEMYGGEFRPYTEATKIMSENGKVTVALADRSTINASKVVIAANKEANDFLPTNMLKIRSQRQVVGFFKGRNMDILSSDGDRPLPSFIIYFRTQDGSADYAYGIPATKYSILYKNFFKAARENGVYGDMRLKKAFPAEKDSLFDFTANFAHISQRSRMRALICGYGVSQLMSFDGSDHSGVQIWSRHPFLHGGYIVHNCDGGGFKHAAGAARQFARMILDMEPSNQNINLNRDFSFVRGYNAPVTTASPGIEEMVNRLTEKTTKLTPP